MWLGYPDFSGFIPERSLQCRNNYGHSLLKTILMIHLCGELHGEILMLFCSENNGRSTWNQNLSDSHENLDKCMCYIYIH